jgi:hypothetical protein
VNGESEVDGDGEDGREDVGGGNGPLRPVHRAPTHAPCRNPNRNVPPDGKRECQPNRDRVTYLEAE